MHAAKLVLAPAEKTSALETVYDNIYWAGAAARLSILVSACRQDASFLIEALARCSGSPLSEIIIYDDGSRDHDLLARMQAAAGNARAAVRIVSCRIHRGRAAARNAALAHARSEWLLLLDAEMAPETAGFLDAYFEAAERIDAPALVCGGGSVRFAPKHRGMSLHRWFLAHTACAPAEARRARPELQLTAGNCLAHRDVLKALPFDEDFGASPWADAEWLLRVAERFSVMHIDNAATYAALKSDKALIAEVADAAKGFARLTERHPDLAPCRAARNAKTLPFRRVFKTLLRVLAAARPLPAALRGRALLGWRALL